MAERGRPTLAPTLIASAAALVLALLGCSAAPWVPPVAHASVEALGLVDAPEPVLDLVVPARSELWLRVTFPQLASGGAALAVVEVLSDAALADGHVRLEWRADNGHVLAVGASDTRYARSFAALGTPDAESDAPADEESTWWRCQGPCLAARAIVGDTYLRIENAGDADLPVRLLAYARRPSDPYEPNDTVASAAGYTLRSNGDGPDGAIEFPGDVDHYRLTCAAGFAGPSDGMRLRLVSDSLLAPSLQLTAGGTRYGVDQSTMVLPCGSSVSVASRDGSAGPGAHSSYTLSASAAPLYALDVPAQSGGAPRALGRLTLAPGETQLARFTFGSSAAGLRFVEVTGVGGSAVDGRVRVEVRSDAGTVGVSDDRRRFAPSLGALVATGPEHGVAASSVPVVNVCLGPCVAQRYRSGSLVAHVTNTSSQTRSVDLYAYGAPESDSNEPNDSAATATRVSVATTGATLTGAIERIGDRDVYTLTCASSRPGSSLVVGLQSAFPGPLALRRLDRASGVRAGGTIEVACGASVVVETTDGSAGPSSSSLYVLTVD